MIIMLKVGLVGVGGISAGHISAWDSFKEAELVALCDIRPEQMKEYKGKKHYTDFDEMLKNEEFDIVDICLPSYLHADYSIKAMEKGINVICEKPISLKREDVKRVYDTARKNNVKFMVAQVLRFWPEYVFLKDIIDTEKYGKLITGSMQRLKIYPKGRCDEWMLDESRSGLVPFDLHIHDLDFLVYTLGRPQGAKSYRSRAGEQDVIEVIYDFNGVYVNCESAWYSARIPFIGDYRFQFEKAVVIFRDNELKVYLNDGTVITEGGKGKSEEDQSFYIPKSDAYANELRYFLDCVLSNNDPDIVKPDELEAVLDVLNSL